MSDKKKKSRINIKYTTGCIPYNLAQFNKRAGTVDNNNPTPVAPFEDMSCKLAAAASYETLANSTAGLGDGAGEGGEGMGESLIKEDSIYVPKMERRIDIPDEVKVLPQAEVSRVISTLAPEELFKVGYITPIYFYKQLVDKLNVIKLTEFEGYTGLDYRDATPTMGNAKALANAQAQAADPYGNTFYDQEGNKLFNTNNNMVKSGKDQYRRAYGLINKTVKQRDRDDTTDVDKNIPNSAPVKVQNLETILFYPKPGSKPKVKYFVKLAANPRYMEISREYVVDKIYKLALQVINKLNLPPYLAAKTRDKAIKAIETDDLTAPDVTLSDGDERDAFDKKIIRPSVRALYLNQVYYISTDKETLGGSLMESLATEALTEETGTKQMYRLVMYDTKFGPKGEQRQIILGKKQPESNIYNVSFSGPIVNDTNYNYYTPKDIILFDSKEQAQNFINNLDKIKTKIKLDDLRINISTKDLDGRYSLNDRVLVDTICGPGYVSKKARHYVDNQTTDESLTEETKRYIKRYYIRPQNIVCSNKEEILKALVEIGDENCSVYSLKNLTDHDDVHLLTNKDIIYYYDDGILYDKNHVKVMDYELGPKHEEERKKVNDVDDLTNKEFSNMYDDRLTDADLANDETIKVKEGIETPTKPFKNPIVIDLTDNGNVGQIRIEAEDEALAREVDTLATEAWENGLDDLDAEDLAGYEYFDKIAAEKGLNFEPVFDDDMDDEYIDQIKDKALKESDDLNDDNKQYCVYINGEPAQLYNSYEDAYYAIEEQGIENAKIVAISAGEADYVENDITDYDDEDWMSDEQQEFIAEMASDDFDTNSVLSKDDFAKFQSLGKEKGFDLVQRDFDYYFDLINTFREEEEYMKDTENPFDLKFESYSANGKRIVEGKEVEEICCICGEPLNGYGNNPAPYKEEGRCCDACNIKFVIPARLAQLANKEAKEE